MIALPDSRRCGSADAGEDVLERFCTTLLDLLRAGGNSNLVLAPVILDLVRGLRASSQETVSRLRREIAAWDEAAGGLRQLADSPFLQLGAETSTLLGNLKQARTQALQIIAALEDLPTSSATRPEPLRAQPGREDLLFLGTTAAPSSQPVAADTQPEDSSETITLPFVQDTTVPQRPSEDSAPGKAQAPAKAPPAASKATPVPKPPVPVKPAPEPPAKPTAAKPAPAANKSRQAPQASTMTVACPACGQPSKLRWERLQAGKVLSCPHCRKNLTARPDGRLSEVVKDRRGRWMEREQQQAQSRLSWLRRSHLAAVTLSVVVLILAVIGTRKLMHRPAPRPAPLPAGLEQRAELFGRAWLKGDTSLMRRLTDPTHDRQLFPWNKRHAPPAASAEPAAEVKTTVAVLPGSSSPTRVLVRFVGLSGAAPGAPLELRTAWQKRGDSWVFSPQEQSK